MSKESQSQAETNALAPIAEKDKMSWVSMAFVQAGVCVCVPAFLLGSLLAEGMSTRNAIISGTLGYIIIVIGMCLTGMMGSDLSTPSVVNVRGGFGKKGSRYIVSFIFALNLIGWFGIQNGLAGEAFTNLLGIWGLVIPVWVSSVIWGLIMLATAVFGLRALEKLDKFSIPFLMIVMILAVAMAIHGSGAMGLNAKPTSSMSFLAGVGLSFNFYAAGVVTAGDFARYQHTRKDTMKSITWGIFPMGVFTLVLGIILSKIAGNYDIAAVLIQVGLPLIGVAALIISTWTTNSTNAYCAGLSVVNVFNLPDNRRREATLVVGLIGTALGAAGILGHVVGVLSLLSIVCTPVAGVMIADYWIVGKGDLKNFRPIDGFNWAGVIAWAVGAGIAYSLTIEWMGILVGFGMYVVLERLIPSTSRPTEKAVVGAVVEAEAEI